MSARDELEAVFWRHWPTPRTQAEQAIAAQAADALLDAADAYAVAVKHSAEDTPQATARRRAVLDLAIADLYDTNSKHRWRAS